MHQHVPHPAELRRLSRACAMYTDILLVLTLLSAPAVPAQMPIQVDTSAPATDVKLPSFDTVFAKENNSGTPMIRIMNKPNGFEATNVPVSDLVAIVYGIRQDLVSGLPDWQAAFPSM